jgi:transposase
LSAAKPSDTAPSPRAAAPCQCVSVARPGAQRETALGRRRQKRQARFVVSAAMRESTPEQRALARELSAKGHSSGMIAYRLGFNRNTIYRWLHPDKAKVYARRKHLRRQRNLKRERAKDRKRARRQRKSVCPVCGRQAPGANVRACKRCLDKDREFIYAEVETLWANGLSTKEIAAEMGRSWVSIQGYVKRMRAAGRDLPLRRASSGSLRVR